MKTIRSAGNPRFMALLRLVHSSAQRRASGLSVLEGAHLVAAYHGSMGPPERLVVSDSGSTVPGIRALIEAMPRVETVLLPDSLFARLSSVVAPTGVIAVIRTPRPLAEPPRAGACVMLEDVQDPGNLGSILRSAAAAGIGHVLLSTHAVNAWSPRVLRAGMGAHFLLGVYERVDLLAAARSRVGRVLALCQRAPQSIYAADLRGDIAFVLGNEGAGISEALAAAAHARFSIPMPGGTESLNVAAAAAVCLFERVRQTQAAGNR
ncbi:MAG: RNA methyltransferase [Burkholderiales bacterium]|nr:RNA methyltransferase [Burkholderiales bacterium]